MKELRPMRRTVLLALAATCSLGLVHDPLQAAQATATTSTSSAVIRPAPPMPIGCPEDPCRIAIGDDLYCAEPQWFCLQVPDSTLDATPTPHTWTPADLDMFLAAIVEGDVDGDIPQSAIDELEALIQSGGDDQAIAAWFATYFDQGSGFTMAGDPGDRISSAACKQACRRIPGILPSQCKKVCNRVKNASRVGFKGLCEHMDRHHEQGKELCWKIYCILWPSHC